MTEKDLKIRKQWFAILVIMPTLGVAYNSYYFANDASMEILPVWYRYTFVSLVIFGSLIFNYLLYRCAYKKPGTKFLSVLLVLTPLSLVGGIWAYISGSVPMPSSPLLWGYTWFANGMAIVWCVLNWKMRSINKRLQKLKVLAS